MNATTLELSAAPPVLMPPAETKTQIAPAVASRKKWPTRMAAWLVLPLGATAVFLLVKVARLADDVFAVLSAIYQAGQS